MHIKTIIVDDTPLAVEKIEGFVAKVPLLQHVQSFNNALDAISYMQGNAVDLVFLDIQMEQLTGLQFMEALQEHPSIVIVSAYSEYAVEGFEHNVTDYLLKPYSFERFLKSVDKVIAEQKKTVIKDYFFVKTEYRMERIDLKDILYIVGRGAYLQIVTSKSKIMTLLNFEQILSLLPSDNFIRTHRSYIVALDKIDAIERNLIRIHGECIPIAKSYQEEFYKIISK